MTTTHQRIEQYIRDDWQPPENSVLTQDEWDVYSLLSASFNAFLKLPHLYPGDQADFAHGINILKNIVMSRPTERELAPHYQTLPSNIDNIEAGAKAIGIEPDDH